MTLYVQFALLGLGAGVLYAVIAQGLIMTWRGAGVMNFSSGAIAMYVAYVYNGLRDGHLLVPPLPNPLALLNAIGGWFGVDLDLPGIPEQIGVGGPMGIGPSIVVALAVAALLGAGIHFLVLRPMRHAPPLAKMISTVGIALLLQSIVVLRFGGQAIAVDPIMPDSGVLVAGTTVPLNQFILLGIAVTIAVVLMAVFRFTRIGLATRAAAENEQAAVLLGLSPERLAAFNWISSSVLAGAVGILFSSTTGLDPTTFMLVVIPALSAALLAGMRSFVGALFAGILIGVLQSITLPLQSDFSWFPQTGAAAGVPFVIIFLVMMIRGPKLPDRGLSTGFKLPRSTNPRRPMLSGTVLISAAAIAVVLLPYGLRGGLINSLIGVIMALSFVVLVGMAGQISLMQLAVAGVAALAMTRLAGDWNLPFPLSPIIAVLVAAACGTLVGLPALRVRGVFLAALTLSAAFTFEQMVLANQDLLRPSDESSSVPSPRIGGFDFGVNASFFFGPGGAPSPWFGLFVIVLVAVCCWAVLRLRRSNAGLRFLAIRSNERAAAGLGINVGATKLLAFALASGVAGIVGVLSAYSTSSLTAGQYLALSSLSALAIAYLGGITSIWGALFAGTFAIGGITQVILEDLFQIGEYQGLISALGLILVAVMNPEGIAGAMQVSADRFKARVGARNPATVAMDQTTEDPKAEPGGVKVPGIHSPETREESGYGAQTD